MSSSARGFMLPFQVLPSQALKVLGLPGRATLSEAQRAHRALTFQLHSDASASKHEAAESARKRREEIVVANKARETIELAARKASGDAKWTNEARLEWDQASKKVHMSAMLGEWEEVIDTMFLGVDPNVLTPAQGAPPIFYASCCDMFGSPSMGRGDEGRLKVLEVLAFNTSTDLSLRGRAMWAEGQTIYDLVSMGRCREAALEILSLGQEATMSMVSQGRLRDTDEGAACFVE